MIEGVKDENELYRLVALKILSNLKKLPFSTRENNADNSEFISLYSILKDTFDESKPKTEFDEYRKTATKKLKKLLKAIDLDLDSFAIKSDVSPNKIQGYKIPKAIRGIFKMFLLADGDKGKTISKLLTQKADKISSEESIDHVMMSIEAESATPISDSVLEIFRESLTKSEAQRIERTATVENIVRSHMLSLSTPLPFGEWMSSIISKYINIENKASNIDIENYENLNPNTVNDYLRQIPPDSFLFDSTDERILFDLYESMIEKVSKKWLEFAMDYAKLRKALEIKKNNLECENSKKHKDWLTERDRILDEYDLSEYVDDTTYCLGRLKQEKLDETMDMLKKESSEKRREGELIISKAKDDWVQNELRNLMQLHNYLIDNAEIEEYLKKIRTIV